MNIVKLSEGLKTLSDNIQNVLKPKVNLKNLTPQQRFIIKYVWRMK